MSDRIMTRDNMDKELYDSAIQYVYTSDKEQTRVGVLNAFIRLQSIYLSITRAPTSGHLVNAY
jgi:hypothetical protein